jgi:DNA repair protein RadA/Sms
VLAVLEARCGVSLAGKDVYLNVAGGLRITEPAADLAVAAALVSAVSDTPAPADAVVFGEIGLSGEVRRVSQAEARLKEAAKLGFARALLPVRGRGKGAAERAAAAGLELTPIPHLRDLVAMFGPARGDGAGRDGAGRDGAGRDGAATTRIGRRTAGGAG